MKTSKRRDPEPETGASPFRALPSFKLETLSLIASRIGELRYQRLFGLRAVECRILAVVAAYGPVSLRRLCVEINLEKSHGSRLVAKLVQLGLLERRDDPADQRSFYLLLSPSGVELHEQISAVAIERNRQWMKGLPADKHAVFFECLELLTRHSQAMLAEEAGLAPDLRLAPAPTHELREPPPAQNPLLLVERSRLKALHEQLGELLGKSG